MPRKKLGNFFKRKMDNQNETNDRDVRLDLDKPLEEGTPDTQPVEEQPTPEEAPAVEETPVEAPKLEVNACSPCGGTGLKDEFNRCPSCQGTGKVA